MSHQIETTISEAAARNLSVSATIERLADAELEARRGRAIERRFKCSRLLAQPSIDAFHFHHHKSRVQAKNRILYLLDLTFLPLGTNVVLIGNPGVGKNLPGTCAGLESLPGESARPVHNRHGYAESSAGFAGRSLAGRQAENLH
jgi:DNA replication protein DnaC